MNESLLLRQSLFRSKSVKPALVLWMGWSSIFLSELLFFRLTASFQRLKPFCFFWVTTTVPTFPILFSFSLFSSSCLYAISAEWQCFHKAESRSHNRAIQNWAMVYSHLNHFAIDYIKSKQSSAKKKAIT